MDKDDIKNRKTAEFIEKQSKYLEGVKKALEGVTRWHETIDGMKAGNPLFDEQQQWVKHEDFISTLESLQRENEELTRHVAELQDKINSEKDCACSYDEAGTVCGVHSPALKAAEAEVKRLQAEIDRKSSMPGDHRYWEGRYRDEAAENERLRDDVKREAELSTHMANDCNDAQAEVKRLREALQNVMGCYDTPLSRRRFPPDGFMKEAINTARTALASTGGEHHADK